MTDNKDEKQKRVGITVFISSEIRDELIKIADKEDLSLSVIVRRALNDYVKEANA